MHATASTCELCHAAPNFYDLPADAAATGASLAEECSCAAATTCRSISARDEATIHEGYRRAAPRAPEWPSRDRNGRAGRHARAVMQLTRKLMSFSALQWRRGVGLKPFDFIAAVTTKRVHSSRSCLRILNPSLPIFANGHKHLGNKSFGLVVTLW